MTNITLGQIKVGDEITQISRTPAARVTVGIRWTDEPQRLVVRSVWSNGTTMFATFDNGGKLLPTPANTPCVVA